MTRFFSILLLALAFTGLGCSPSYDPAAEPFTAEFPGKPKKITRTVTRNGMTLEVHYVGYASGNRAFSVVYSDYPSGHVQSTGAENVLAGARNGAAQSVGGRIVHHESITLGNHVGQEVKIKDAGKGMEMRNRMYLVGDRMYQVMVVAKTGNSENAEANDFLDSFELK